MGREWEGAIGKWRGREGRGVGEREGEVTNGKVRGGVKWKRRGGIKREGNGTGAIGKGRGRMHRYFVNHMGYG